MELYQKVWFYNKTTEDWFNVEKLWYYTETIMLLLTLLQVSLVYSFRVGIKIVTPLLKLEMW